MKLLGSTKSKIIKDENSKNVSHLEFTEVALMLCDIVNKGYQINSRILYTFIPNKSFRQLLEISPKNFMILKTF